MMNEIVISTLEQGLIFAIVAIGGYITYKIWVNKKHRFIE